MASRIRDLALEITVAPEGVLRRFEMRADEVVRDLDRNDEDAYRLTVLAAGLAGLADRHPEATSGLSWVRLTAAVRPIAIRVDATGLRNSAPKSGWPERDVIGIELASAVQHRDVPTVDNLFGELERKAHEAALLRSELQALTETFDGRLDRALRDDRTLATLVASEAGRAAAAGNRHFTASFALLPRTALRLYVGPGRAGGAGGAGFESPLTGALREGGLEGQIVGHEAIWGTVNGHAHETEMLRSAAVAISRLVRRVTSDPAALEARLDSIAPGLAQLPLSDVMPTDTAVFGVSPARQISLIEGERLMEAIEHGGDEAIDAMQTVLSVADGNAREAERATAHLDAVASLLVDEARSAPVARRITATLRNDNVPAAALALVPNACDRLRALGIDVPQVDPSGAEIVLLNRPPSPSARADFLGSVDSRWVHIMDDDLLDAVDASVAVSDVVPIMRQFDSRLAAIHDRQRANARELLQVENDVIDDLADLVHRNPEVWSAILRGADTVRTLHDEPNMVVKTLASRVESLLTDESVDRASDQTRAEDRFPGASGFPARIAAALTRSDASALIAESRMLMRIEDSLSIDTTPVAARLRTTSVVLDELVRDRRSRFGPAMARWLADSERPRAVEAQLTLTTKLRLGAQMVLDGVDESRLDYAELLSLAATTGGAPAEKVLGVLDGGIDRMSREASVLEKAAERLLDAVVAIDDPSQSVLRRVRAIDTSLGAPALLAARRPPGLGVAQADLGRRAAMAGGGDRALVVLSMARRDAAAARARLVAARADLDVIDAAVTSALRSPVEMGRLAAYRASLPDSTGRGPENARAPMSRQELDEAIEHAPGLALALERVSTSRPEPSPGRKGPSREASPGADQGRTSKEPGTSLI